MNVVSKVVGFSVALTLVFTFVANILPQVEGEPPADEVIDLGSLTMDDFINLGESTFRGKGTCTLCHNDLGRAPDLLVMDVATVAEERLQDARYAGSATNGEEYLLESFVDPSAYVVAGFGQMGSNDSVSPMPAVNAAPVLLSDVEMSAIIAFLQNKDGNQVTVALPTDIPVVEPEPIATADAPKVDATAAELVAQYACFGCHSIYEFQSVVGPSLNDVADRLSRNEIRESIVEPGAVIAEGFPPIMPPNIADNMSVKELETLVSALSNMKTN